MGKTRAPVVSFYMRLRFQENGSTEREYDHVTDNVDADRLNDLKRVNVKDGNDNVDADWLNDLKRQCQGR